MSGELVGKKKTDVKTIIMSHRDLIFRHFKHFNIHALAINNVISNIKLNETEEIIIFMLIAGFTQQEIGDFLKLSRSYIFKIIAESLCIKFNISLISTKLLIEKALELGYANFIPKIFTHEVNEINANIQSN